MSSEVSVRLTPEAVEDLQGLGRLRARLLSRALHDELRTPNPSLASEPVSKPNWRALQIGDYRVLYYPEVVAGQDQEVTHLVTRILDSNGLDEFLQEDVAESPASSGSS
jgi:mRNA-degrading endonuclease RelE of RelBE toxin-antitoxin system